MESKSTYLNEEWVKLEREIIPEGHFIVTKFVQNVDGVKIALDDEKNLIEIFFDGIPLLIRSATEGIRMRTWSEIQLKYQNKYFFKNWFFYQIHNSELSKWAIEESCGFYDEKQITHYCIVTSEEFIDILTTFKPSIKVSQM